MASILGVSSLYHTPAALELSRRATRSLRLMASNSAAVNPSSHRCSHVPLAITTPTPTPSAILSEEAFKGLDGVSKSSSSLLESDENNLRRDGGGVDANDNPGQPPQLADSVHDRGITYLFPTQLNAKIKLGRHHGNFS